MAGVFITLEGVEGAGKSTQISLLATLLQSLGHDVVVTREPGGTEGAEAIRDLLVNGSPDRWGALTECLLMNAARSDHLDRLIRPALAAGQTVICDRFMDSTRAYQGFAGDVPMDAVRAIEAQVVRRTKPNLTLILDLPEEQGLARAAARGGEDRFEQKGAAFHTAVRNGFRQIARAEPDRCRLIASDGSVEDVADRIARAVRDYLEARP